MKTLFAAMIAFFSFVAVPAMAAKVSPTEVAGATTVTTDEAKSLFEDGAVFVDVRKDSDWDAGRIPGAYHIELKQKYNEATLAEVVSKQEKVVLYCNGDSCMRSSEASAKAAEWGFASVYYYRDGFPAWEAAGHPVE